MPPPDPGQTRRGVAVVRCAVYTRKSSDDGLEQDFNSLHAQREACEAYIKSQKHEGWVASPEAYDDGGISGATMERAALQRLLADIRARKIDTVVVYKVDRLTRSLADFAKLVETFDAHTVSFVSVTQSFNTTTSMGRLTLNVLLSFAQFEREVAGERIRDKIAASKKRGMWMGGNPPLGYDVRDRKLVVNEPEAETVRHIFRRYLALGSVILLVLELAATGIESKHWTTATGRVIRGRRLVRGALYVMLRNRLYLGEVVHKDTHYPGQHQAIMDRETWNRAQALLDFNAGQKRAGRQAKQPALLTGLIFDDHGRRMSPTHALKKGKRYRYYTSRASAEEEQEGRRNPLERVPGPELEQVVTDRLRELLSNESEVFDMLDTIDTERRGTLVARAAELSASWPDLSSERHRHVIATLIARVVLRSDTVELHVRPARLKTLLDPVLVADPQSESPTQADEPTIILSAKVNLQRVGRSMRLIVPASQDGASRPNASLIKLMGQAHRLREALTRSEHGGVDELARHMGLNRVYVTRVIRLSWLSPEIVEKILRGQHSRTLTAEKLLRATRIPIDWPGQRAVFGFS